MPKPYSLQRAPAGQGSLVLPWLTETLLGFGLCERLPRHGVGRFLFVSLTTTVIVQLINGEKPQLLSTVAVK